MIELLNKVNELNNKCNELLKEPTTDENIALAKEYLKEMDALLKRIEVYNGEGEMGE